MIEIDEIRSSVKKLAEKEIPKYQSEKYYNTVPRELFNSFASLGLCGLSIDEAYGGSKQSAEVIAAVMYEISKVDAGAAIFLSVHLMVSGLLNRFASEEQKKLILPKLASGEQLAAFALTEPDAGSDAANLKTKAAEDNGAWVLNGEKCYITSAGFADVYLLFARSSSDEKVDRKKAISAFFFQADVKGLSISPPEHKMGAELSPIASLNMKNVTLGEEALVGEKDAGYGIALGGLAGGRINIGACANGISDHAIEKATAYLKERKQFGKTLANFQGLQFMLADMATKAEAAKLLVAQAARTLDADKKSKLNRTYPAYAKCFATDTAMEVTTDAVQLFGGAGYIKEYGVEKLMRDAKMLQIVEGSNQIQRLVIARELLA